VSALASSRSLCRSLSSTALKIAALFEFLSVTFFLISGANRAQPIFNFKKEVT